MDLPSKEQLANLWCEEFAPEGFCCLCGNSGIIDTRGRVSTAAGHPCGARVPCICPNGRIMKGVDSAQSKTN